MSISYNIPESVEEFDQNAKRVGACLDEACTNIILRANNAVYRDGFLHGFSVTEPDPADPTKFVQRVIYAGLEAETGIVRATTERELQSKNADGSAKTTTVFAESEETYWKRVRAQLVANGTYANDAEVLAHYTPIANEIAAAIPFDASETERKAPQPKTASKELLATAQQIIDAGKAEKVAKYLGKKLGREVGLTVDALALAMRDDLRAEEEVKKAKFREMALG
jgi:hypothetical protein